MAENKIDASKPSMALHCLRLLARRRILRRGYGWLLVHLPAWFWGGHSIVADTVAGDMVVPIHDQSSVPLLLFGRLPHETFETQLFERLRSVCRICLDVGAHYGWYTRVLTYPSQMSSVERVIAFEPNRRTYTYLQTNSIGNAMIRTFPYAVGCQTQTVNFYCNNLHSDLSTAARPSGSGSVSVQGIALDDFCIEYGLMGKIDLIKCDVEGNELDVLQGARKLTATQHPPIWLIEVIDEFLAEIDVSADDFMNTVKQFGETHLFSWARDGSPVPITHVQERTQTNNVIIVPSVRLQDFLRAVNV